MRSLNSLPLVVSLLELLYASYETIFKKHGVILTEVDEGIVLVVHGIKMATHYCHQKGNNVKHNQFFTFLAVTRK